MPGTEGLDGFLEELNFFLIAQNMHVRIVIFDFRKLFVQLGKPFLRELNTYAASKLFKEIDALSLCDSFHEFPVFDVFCLSGIFDDVFCIGWNNIGIDFHENVLSFRAFWRAGY